MLRVLNFFNCSIQHIHTAFHLPTTLCYAKSHQSCPTLCDPKDSSPPGSAVPGILQARTLEWVAISFSNAWKWKVKVKSLSHVRLSDPMDCSLPGSSIPGIFQARVLEWVAIAFSVLPPYWFFNFWSLLLNQGSEKILPSLSEHVLSVLHVIISCNPHSETLRCVVSLFLFPSYENRLWNTE